MSEFLGTATIVIILWYGGTLILGNNSPIDAPTFIYYLVIFYSIINPAKDLSKSVYAIQKGLASVERVDKILRAESDIVSPAAPQPVHFRVTMLCPARACEEGGPTVPSRSWMPPVRSTWSSRRGSL